MDNLLDLRFFDGAAAAGAAAEGASATVGNAAEGGQQAQAGAQVTTNTQDERKAAYDKLVKEYKDIYAQDFQQKFDMRFKEHKTLQSKMQALDPILGALGSKYGVDPSDIKALQEAIDADDSYFEQAAEDAGMTVEQFKRTRQLEQELAYYRQQREQGEREEAVQQKLAEWNEQAEQVKALYPDFDLAKQANDPITGVKFMQLLQGGLVNVQEAYELVNPQAKEARIANGAAMVAQLTQRQTLDTIRAKGARPAENGAGGAPVKTGLDVSRLTREQRQELADRARRGETIDLKTRY